MLPEPRVVGWALAGNAIIAVGSGTATVAAFAPSLPLGPDTFLTRTLVVAIGFAVFFAGYHVSQVGTYRDPSESLVTALVPGGFRNGQTSASRSPLVLVRAGFLLLGVLGLGAGLRLFAMSVESWDPTIGLLCGIVFISGYIAGHIGINWVLI